MPTMHESTASPEQLRLMVKVARMYHERGMRQCEIASELHISQPRVSRLLKSAAAAGIVRTIVTSPPGIHTEAEDALERKYGLNEVVVAETPDSPDLLLPALGAAGAAYLAATLMGQETIGISSWSSTLLAIAENLPEARTKVADQVVQLVGGNSGSAALIQANRLVTRLASLTGAEPVFLNAPGLLGTPDAVTSLLAAPSLREVVDTWQRLTLVLVGIGAIEPSPLAVESGNVFGPVDLDTLRALGAVGDICFRFFDVDGRLVHSDLLDTVVGIAPEQLRAVPRRVGVAGGPHKVPAIRAALRGGWINVLVTDLQTGESLLSD